MESKMFKSPFSFHGRIRRKEYALSFLIYIGLDLLVVMLANILGNNMASFVFMMLCFIPMYWFLIAQTAKRCHDCDHSGWWMLIPFYVYLLFFFDGDPHENDYGADPKGRNLYE